MKTKLGLLVLLGFLGASAAFSQETPSQDTIIQEQVTEDPIQPSPPRQKKSIGDKLYFGGYFNMSFGQYTLIGIEPMVGYKLIPRLSVGAEVRYNAEVLFDVLQNDKSPYSRWEPFYSVGVGVGF